MRPAPLRRVRTHLALAAATAVVPTAMLVSTAPTATADSATLDDPAADAPRSVDVTSLVVRHGQGRIRAVVQVPRLDRRHLSGTELLVRTPGRRNVYVATVLRDRRGRVVDTSLSRRPVNDPVEPRVLPCGGIHTSLAGDPERTLRVSVPTSCLTRSVPLVQIQAKVRLVDGTSGLDGAYWDEQTRWTPWVAPYQHDRPAQAGRATAAGGLVVRELPTTRSPRVGVLRRGERVELACAVSGEVVLRGDPDAGDVENAWYRLTGGRAFVSAAYVRLLQRTPQACGDGSATVGRVTKAFRPREAPVTDVDAHGGARPGDRVTILCRLKAQPASGDRYWYSLPHGLWLPAATVRVLGPGPDYCVG